MSVNDEKTPRTRGAWLGAGAAFAWVAIGAALWHGCFDFGHAADDTGPASMDAAEPADATPADAVTEDAPAEDAPLPEAIVRIRSLAFDPAVIRVPVGTTVRWIMDDPGVFHFIVQGAPRMTDPPPQFDSPQMDPGDEWTYTFNEPGEFVYHCSNHSSIMRDAMIIVE